MVREVPPNWLRKLEVLVLMRSFARAFGVEAPSLRGLSAGAALRTYCAYTASCMELALEDGRVASFLRMRLGEEAYALGRAVRRLVPCGRARAFDVARYFYRGIGIGLAGELPGNVCFAPCLFSERYTPQDCRFMSAFDEGFMRGLTGLADAPLVFFCRLTQGASCCGARFGLDGKDEGGVQ